MIKALAPILGDFHGTGRALDGTEQIYHWSGQELVDNVCYGFKVSIIDATTQQKSVSAFILASSNDDGQLKVELTNSQGQTFHMDWMSSEKGETPHSRRFQFKSDSQSHPLHLSIDVISAEELSVKLVKMVDNRETKCLWNLHGFRHAHANKSGKKTA